MSVGGRSSAPRPLPFLLLLVLLVGTNLFSSTAATTTPPHSTPVHLDLNTDAPLTLRHNAQPLLQTRAGRHRVRLALRHGDVLAVSMRAASRQGEKPSRLAVRLPLSTRIQWRVAPADASSRLRADPSSSSSYAWLRRGALPAACDWPLAHMRDGVLFHRAGGPGPYDDNAGATEDRGPVVVHLRGVVGGEERCRTAKLTPLSRRAAAVTAAATAATAGPLPPSSQGQFAQTAVSRSVMKRAEITVAANNRAWVFVNGRRVGDISSSAGVFRYGVDVSQGDVIGILATTTSGQPGGVIADVLLGGRHYVTGGGISTGWRVSVAKGTTDYEKVSKGYNDCGWDGGRSAVHATVEKAAKFPYEHGARYVWPGAAGANQVFAVARFVVDATERCVHKLVTTCNCEVAKTERRSQCYYFIDWRQHSCAWRPCDSQYVCSERATGMVCMLRKVTRRVMPVDGRVGQCKVEATNHVMYVPYEKSR